jgi:pimeloyl-ACP methyl ester carboxylesterase
VTGSASMRGRYREAMAGRDDATTGTVHVAGCALTTATWGEGPPEVIVLHDGLGSIAQWRDVPAAIAEATGRTVLAYDRAGHGRSTPVPTGPWPADWLHREARVLGAVIDAVGAQRPALVGHSDGGSIAAIHAMDGGATGPIVLLAAHSWVERATYDAIAEMRRAPERIVRALARAHDAPDALFEAWSGVWTGEEFGRWDIRDRLGAIDVPVLVVQGEADEYATPHHAIATTEAIGANATCRLLPELGHLLHHQAADTVVRLVTEHLDRRSTRS